MRKIATLFLLLGSFAASATEQTPTQIKNSAASTFTANGAGAITGPNVGTAVTNIADSFIPMLYATSGCYWKSNGIGLSASCDYPVTSVGASFTGGLISIAGSPVTTTGTFALTVAGTSGGVPYFSSASTWASSALLTSNALMLGGGAGAAPKVLASLGTTTTVLHGNAAGAPTFGPVSLTADVTGTLPTGNLPTAAASDVRTGTSTTTVVTPGALSGSAAAQTLTDAATINWNMASGYNAKITLTASGHTFAAPTNVIEGLTYTLQLDVGAGPYTVNWNAAFNWGAAGTPTISAVANKVDVVSCIARTTSNLLCTINKRF